MNIWYEGMDRDDCIDAAEDSSCRDDYESTPPSQSSWFKERLWKLKGSRAYYALARPGALSIAGASIGAISIALLTWSSRQVPIAAGLGRVIYVTENSSFFDLLTTSEPAVTVAMITFLVATAFAFLIPAFSVLQALGLIGFMIHFHSGIHEASELGVGYYLSIVSTIILLISCKTIYSHHTEDQPVPAISRIAALQPRATRYSK